MAKQSFASIIAAQDELCNWELIDRSDFEDDDSVYELEIIDLDECFDSLSSSSEDDSRPRSDVDLDGHHHHDDGDAMMMMGSPPTYTFEDANYGRVLDLGQDSEVTRDNFSNYASDLDYTPPNGRQYYDYGLRQVHHDEDDDEHRVQDDVDDDDDGGYDVDDELVPWGVKDRFERQRMRKLGKRSFAKMTKSKKSAYIYTRPGCVRGKHGLGLKGY